MSIRTLVVASLLVPGSSVLAATVECVVNDKESVVETSSEITLTMPGTLIGDYDSVNNPGGTLTRPGFAGGSGNLPVDISLAPSVAGATSATPTGSFTVDYDALLSTIVFEDLSLDLLHGGSAIFPVNVAFTYETFRTFVPDSLFIWLGVPVSIPLGEATITAMTAVQSGPGVPGVLTETGSGTWSYTAAVPVSLSITAEFLGQVIEIPGLPGVLPLTGVLTESLGAVAVTISTSQIVDDTNDGPFEGVGFTNLPFELPTVLPPGGLAGVLLTANLTQVATHQEIQIDIVANGSSVIPGDVNGDGVVNFQDVIQILNAWGPCDGCPEDLSGDGQAGFQDVLIVISNWS